MIVGSISIKSVKTALISNLEAFIAIKHHNINFKLYYVALKILRKISQIKILN